MTHDALKIHILQIVDHIDNLACPSCNEKCADLLDLADHLGRECINLSTNQKEKLSPRKRRNEHDGVSQIPDLSKVKNEVGDVCETDQGKQNLQFLWEVNIVTVVDNKQSNETKVPMNPEDITDDPNMIYSCEVCNTTFSSVKDHLAKFHEGEEVVLVSFI